MLFSGGILVTSRLNKPGGLADSLKAKCRGAGVAYLIMQQLARSKGLSPAEQLVFNQIHSWILCGCNMVARQLCK